MKTFYTTIANCKHPLPYIKCSIFILRCIPYVFMYVTTVFVVEIDHHDCDLWALMLKDIMDECGNVEPKPRQMCRN